MGFREMHLFNLALLGKQGWRLITMKPLGHRTNTDKEFVSELIDPSTHLWNEPLIRELFFVPDLERILQIPLRHSQGVDGVAWALEAKGIYSVRSAYRGLVAEKELTEELQGEARPPPLLVMSSNGGNSGNWMFNQGYEYFGGEFSKAFCQIMQLLPGGMSKNKVPVRFVILSQRP